VTTDVSETGHRYQLLVRGECGPLTEWLFGDAAIGTRDGGTSLIVSARDDSDLYGVLDRIQGPWTPPGHPRRGRRYRSGTPSPVAGGSCPVRGFPLRRPRDPITPPVGSRGPGTRCPGRRTRNAKASAVRPAAKRTVAAGLVRRLVRPRVAVVPGAARPAPQRHMAHTRPWLPASRAGSQVHGIGLPAAGRQRVLYFAAGRSHLALEDGAVVGRGYPWLGERFVIKL
jgi:hypothetical protein